MWRLLVITVLTFCLISLAESRRPSGNRKNYRNRGLTIGGRKANDDEATWQVALIRNRGLICSGTLIESDVVLTAADCIKDIDPAELLVRAGSKTFKNGGQLRKVRETIHHPDYDEETHAYNAAILHLMRPLNSTDNDISLITLADESVEVPSNIYIYGWGITRSKARDSKPKRTVTKRLRSVRARLQSSRKCSQLLPKSVDMETVFCSGERVKKVDICNDDLGSPAIGTDGLQYGLVSETGACSPDVYSTVFTNVRTIRPWIDDTIKSLNPVKEEKPSKN